MQLKNVIDHDLNEMDIWSKKWLVSFNPYNKGNNKMTKQKSWFL